MPSAKKRQVVFGFTGLIASGKSSCSKYFAKRYGALTFRMSEVLRQALDVLSMDKSRDNLIKISEALRDKFGEDILSRAIIGKIKKSRRRLIVVEGLRHLSDLRNFEKLPNFIMVAVEVAPKIRYARVLRRKENQDDNRKTYTQFLADHRRSTEKNIPRIMARAKERINNEDGYAALKKQLDVLYKKYCA